MTLLTRIEDVEPFDAVFDAWFRKEPAVRIEVSLPAPDETGEALVPGAGREGELPAESLGEGSGLEASGVEVVARKTFPAAGAETRDVLREIHAALPRALPDIRGAAPAPRPKRTPARPAAGLPRGEPDRRRGRSAFLARPPATSAARAPARRRLRLDEAAQH